MQRAGQPLFAALPDQHLRQAGHRVGSLPLGVRSEGGPEGRGFILKSRWQSGQRCQRRQGHQGRGHGLGGLQGLAQGVGVRFPLQVRGQGGKG